MIIHEEPSPNSVSSPVSTAKDSRCYTVEVLMEMLLLSRPTVYRLDVYKRQAVPCSMEEWKSD